MKKDVGHKLTSLDKEFIEIDTNPEIIFYRDGEYVGGYVSKVSGGNINSKKELSNNLKILVNNAIKNKFKKEYSIKKIKENKDMLLITPRGNKSYLEIILEERDNNLLVKVSHSYNGHLDGLKKEITDMLEELTGTYHRGVEKSFKEKIENGKEIGIEIKTIGLVQTKDDKNNSKIFYGIRKKKKEIKDNDPYF